MQHHARRGRPVVLWLQFGHGTDAVDALTAAARWGCLPTGFNSATALTPWMRIQLGPCLATVRGFNSATALTPWMRPAWTLFLTGPVVRFNSATALTPWMLGVA